MTRDGVNWSAWVALAVGAALGAAGLWVTLDTGGKFENRTAQFRNHLLLPIEITLDGRLRGTLAPDAVDTYQMDHIDGEYSWRVVNPDAPVQGTSGDDIEVKGAAKGGVLTEIEARAASSDNIDYFAPIIRIDPAAQSGICELWVGDFADYPDHERTFRQAPGTRLVARFTASQAPMPMGYWAWRTSWVGDLECDSGYGAVAVATTGARPDGGGSIARFPGTSPFFRPTDPAGGVDIGLLDDGNGQPIIWVMERASRTDTAAGGPT